MSATVIIPTTGSPEVKTAVESVLNQSHPTECYVVIDGDEHMDKTLAALGSAAGSPAKNSRQANTFEPATA